MKDLNKILEKNGMTLERYKEIVLRNIDDMTNLPPEESAELKQLTEKVRYRGYWCIEAAALVKALELDDRELKDCKYYPYDMAHFC